MALAVAGCALASAPLAAQSNNSATAPPPSSDIGPGELSNFSLNGTVTRPAERPAATQPAQSPGPAPTVQTPQGEARSAPTAPTARPPATAPARTESDLFRRPPTLPGASAGNAAVAEPPFGATANPTANPALEADGFSMLPWIVALLAVAGMAVMVFGYRRRARAQDAVPEAVDVEPHDPLHGVADPAAISRPDPAPAAASGVRRPLPTTLMPPPAQPRAPPTRPVQPRADPVAPGGIISTGLRPWLDIDLIPDRAFLDDQGTAIAFDVTLFNSGSAAARDVIVEARLLNAGASQDDELGAFFAAAAKPGDPIPQIAPYARIPLRSAVRLGRADIRQYEIEGRKLFVPLVAISVRYRWSSGEGHSAAGFLIGQGGEDREKLAPLRIDQGDRSWTQLGVRRYEKGLRS